MVSERDVVMWLHEHGTVPLSQLYNHFKARFLPFGETEKKYLQDVIIKVAKQIIAGGSQYAMLKDNILSEYGLNKGGEDSSPPLGIGDGDGGAAAGEASHGSVRGGGGGTGGGGGDGGGSTSSGGGGSGAKPKRRDRLKDEDLPKWFVPGSHEDRAHHSQVRRVSDIFPIAYAERYDDTFYELKDYFDEQFPDEALKMDFAAREEALAIEQYPDREDHSRKLPKKTTFFITWRETSLPMHRLVK